MVAMRPKTTKADLPTTDDVTNHLHNEFIKWLHKTQADIEVSGDLIICTDLLTFFPSGCPRVGLDDS